jgi:signal transduction histidine kinase
MADADLDGFTADPDLQLVAYSGPVPLAERADLRPRATAARERLLEALAAGELTREEYERAAAELHDDLGQTVAIFRES